MLSKALLFLAPLCYLAIAGAIAALAAYPLFFFLDGSIDFHKLVSRGALLLLVLGIFPIMRWQKLSLKDLGFTQIAGLPAQVAKGFGYGLIILSLNLALLFLFDVRVTDLDNATVSSVAATMGKSLAVGALVAVIEEPLFRGVLLTTLANKTGAWYGVWVSALYYSGLHFLKADSEIPVADLHWYSGYTVIAGACASFGERIDLDSFLALLAVGVFLASLRINLKLALGYCIGLHASWVFLIKICKRYTDLNPVSPLSWFVGGYDYVIGYPTALMLLLLTGTFLILCRRVLSP